jgi:hypothetical protein
MPEDGILHSHRRGNLESDTARKCVTKVGADVGKSGQAVYTSSETRDCDSGARRFLQHSTGLAAAGLAHRQSADRMSPDRTARPSRSALGSAPDFILNQTVIPLLLFM